MNLFTLIAGRSEHTFTVGDFVFEAAPLTLMELGELFAIRGRAGITFDERAEFIASKLRLRVVKVDPIKITQEWLLEAVGLPELDLLEYVLTYGEMPEKKAPGDEAKKA